MQQIKHVGFCAGKYFESLGAEYTRGLAYCVDNDAGKWGTKCMGIPVVAPDMLCKENKSGIFISVYTYDYYYEISEQLMAMGYAEGVHYEKEMPGLLWENKYKAIFQAAFLTSHEQVDGDYYEFGVYKGATLIDAYKMISRIDRFCSSRYREERPWLAAIPRFRCFCFDSFEGLPKPVGIDKGGFFGEGDYKCDYDTFIRNLAAAGVDMDRVTVIKGWYNSLGKETIEKYEMKSARIIHIDCDLYESARDALAFCTNLITDGTIIIFDDWFLFKGHPDKGEQRAFREWQIANPGFKCTEYMREYPFRNSFIVNIL